MESGPTSTASLNPYSLSALKQNGAIKSQLQAVKNYHHHTSSMPANLNELPNTIHQMSESHVYAPPQPQPPLVNFPPAQPIVNASSTLNSSWPVSPVPNGTNGYLSADSSASSNLSHSTGNLPAVNGYYANSRDGIATATGPLPPPPMVSNGSSPNLNSSNDNSGILSKALNAIRYVQGKAAELIGAESEPGGQHYTPTPPPSWSPHTYPYVPSPGVPPPPPYYAPSPVPPAASFVTQQAAPNQFGPNAASAPLIAPGATNPQLIAPSFQPPATQAFYQSSAAGYPPPAPNPSPGFTASASTSAAPYASTLSQSHLHPHLSPITTQPMAGLPSPHSPVPPPGPCATLAPYCAGLPGAGLMPQTCWSAPVSGTASPVPFAPAGLRSRQLPSMSRGVRLTAADASESRPSPLACPLLTDPATRTHTPGWNDPPPLGSIGVTAASTTSPTTTTTVSGDGEATASAPSPDANAAQPK